MGDDIVTEILVCMPPKSIFRYRSLSQHWNSLLTSPDFLSHYSRRFHQRQRARSPPNLLTFFLHPKFTEYNNSDLGFFITSSNGLVLCGRNPDPRSYHILNPMTRKHVSLPPPRRNYPAERSVGLSCDENSDDLTPRYVVVIADIPRPDPENMVCMETYSSETKQWRAEVLVATSNFRLIASYPPTVVNGVFYWLAEGNVVAVHDPRNKQSRDLELIQLPDNPVNIYAPLFRHVLSRTPDGRRLIFGRNGSGVLKVWEKVPESGWELMYAVACRMEVAFVGVTTWDPLILMVRVGRSMFQYNMETNVVKPADESFFEPISFSSYLLA